MTAVEAAATEAVRNNDGLRTRVTELVELALTQAKKDLSVGTPAVRQKVYGTLLPSLLHALGDDTVDEELEEIRAEQRRLSLLFQQGVADPTADVDAEPIPEDAPPPAPKRKRAPRGS